MPDLAAVLARDALREREAEAAALDAAPERVVRAVKGLEDFLLVAVGDAHAAVEDGNIHPAVVEPGVKLHLLVSIRIFFRIREQVHEHLRERIVVAEHGIRPRRGLPSRGEARVPQVHLLALPHARGELVQIERLQIEPLLLAAHFCKIEHVVDQPREAFRLDGDDAQILVLLFRGLRAVVHQLREHADARERRLQLVRHIRDEVRLLLRERELPARIRDDEPSAECDERHRARDGECERAPQAARTFRQRRRAREVERRLPMRQRLADFTRDEGPLPVARGCIRGLGRDGLAPIVEQREDKFRLRLERPARRCGMPLKHVFPKVGNMRGLDEASEDHLRRFGRTHPIDQVQLVLHETRDQPFVALLGEAAKFRRLRDDRGHRGALLPEHLLRLHLARHVVREVERAGVFRHLRGFGRHVVREPRALRCVGIAERTRCRGLGCGSLRFRRGKNLRLRFDKATGGSRRGLCRHRRWCFSAGGRSCGPGHTGLLVRARRLRLRA